MIENLARESGGTAFPLETPKGLLADLGEIDPTEVSLSRVLGHEFGHQFQFSAERRPKDDPARQILDRVLPKTREIDLPDNLGQAHQEEEQFAEAFSHAVTLLRLENAGLSKENLTSLAKRVLPGAVELRDWMRDKLNALKAAKTEE